MISKCPFGVIVSTKIPTKLRISALVSKKKSNLKIRVLFTGLTFFTPNDFILTLLHYFFELTSFKRLGQKSSKSIIIWGRFEDTKGHFEINWPLKELGLQQNISAKLEKKLVTTHHCVTRKAATVVSSFVVLFSSISCQDSSVRYLFAKQHSVVELHVQQLKVDFWERSNSKIYSSIGIKFR